MNTLLDFLHNLDLVESLLFFSALNLLTFCSSVGMCWVVGQIFHRRRLFNRWEPFSPVEAFAAVVCTALNSLVSVVGWKLWILGEIKLKTSGPIWIALADTILMVLAMDFGMYCLHRLGHHPWLFRIFHSFHHRHEVTNPISLFVLHPFEVLGFGGLMIGFLALYPMDPVALIGYLALNVVFGTLGHSGVEPFPKVLSQIPLLRLVGTSTFHAGHHEHQIYNFGFYTLIWDQLFKTLDPGYWQRYRVAVGQ